MARVLYVSTRNKQYGVTAAEAIRLGIAPDGGLFTPAVIPVFTTAELMKLAAGSYQEIALAVMTRFLTEYEPGELRKMIGAAYVCPLKFDHPEVTPLRKLAENQYLLELWHGPTCAFKDVALQLLPHLMTRASLLTDDSREIVILVATSGDTGKAALEGFKDVPGTRIIVFFPEQGVSEIQRLQMVTQEGRNTMVVSVRGNFDDAQNGVKRIFTDPGLAAKLEREKMAFSSANSINWGRLAPQIVYYFYGYFQLCRHKAVRLGEPINITVPTGNFGNILAAYIAKQMGLPVWKLICASNSNNVLTDFLKDGVYDRNRSFYNTISPSMDILISSNLERLLYYLTGGDDAAVNEWMSQLKTTGRYRVDPATAGKLAAEFRAGFATEPETMAAIRKVYLENRMIIDPHTAVGVAVYERYLEAVRDRTPVLFASTASPFKFSASVLQAIGQPVEGKSEFALLEKLGEVSGQPVPKSLSELSRKEVRHHTVCRWEEMGTIVERLLRL